MDTYLGLAKALSILPFGKKPETYIAGSAHGPLAGI